MSLYHSFGHNVNNYPKIKIDRSSVIRPCNVENQNAADQFISRKGSSWRKLVRDTWQGGVTSIAHLMTDLQVSNNTRPFNAYLSKALQYLSVLLLHIHQICLFIYSYFYPYSLMPLDEVCDRFCRCVRWSDAVIRAFAWHPNHDRCALAICNDYIYIYQGPARIRVLRHAQQRKITDLAWQPSSKEILVVATQEHIIIWRVSENSIHPQSIMREQNQHPTYLSPTMQVVMRTKESNSSSKSTNGAAQLSSQAFGQSSRSEERANQLSDFKIINHVLPAPIVSIQFDRSGSKLYACSPNSSRIAIIDINPLIPNSKPDEQLEKDGLKKYKPINHMMILGKAFTKLLWSPEKDRLATITTSDSVRVFESATWSHNNWSIGSKPIQDIVWSQPHGRILLIANKEEPYLYALAFPDDPQAGDVGGNKSIMRALDLSATSTEAGDIVGGLIQSLAWDRNGKRLAISFKDNPNSILLYRTIENSTVEFQQLGVIQSETGSYPLLMEFHEKFKAGSLLTICWSDGYCQHIPMFYTPNEHTRLTNLNDTSLNKSINNSSLCNSLNGSTIDLKSPLETSRSLVNFCHVSGNNGISTYPASLMPINKVQHQTKLFSLSGASLLDVSKDSLNPND